MSLESTERPLSGDIYVAVSSVDGQYTGLGQPGEAQMGIRGQQVREDLGKEILEAHITAVEAK
jgi:hypothetical protein